MNRIDKTFQSLRRREKKAFVAYLTAGDPDLRQTQRLVLGLAQNGCDVVELGIPFSDPIADGAVNQRAAQRALKSGTTLGGILAMVKDLRRETEIPIVLFSYFNPIHRMGLEAFAARAAKAGVDGVLILDLPPEEAGAARKSLTAHGLKMIFLVAPTSSQERIRKICAPGSGFLYCVSRTGVTGAGQSALSEVKAMVRDVRRTSRLPVVVGFGVSTPEQVKAIGAIADGVVVGSAIVARIEKNPSQPAKAVLPFVARLTRALEK